MFDQYPPISTYRGLWYQMSLITVARNDSIRDNMSNVKKEYVNKHPRLKVLIFIHCDKLKKRKTLIGYLSIQFNSKLSNVSEGLRSAGCPNMSSPRHTQSPKYFLSFSCVKRYHGDSDFSVSFSKCLWHSSSSAIRHHTKSFAYCS